MTRIRTGSALAAAAVVVALPRHLVAQLHQAGYPSPSGPVWPVVVIGSAIAWAGLEAGTMFLLWSAYSSTRRRHLLWLMFAILGAIAATNAPSLVADSAGLTLTALVGVASIAHWSWSVASIAATLLVVVAAGAADAASEAAHIADRVDALDDRRAEAVTAVAAAAAIAGPSETETGVSALLVDGAKSSAEIARLLGVSSSAVRMTDAWRNRVKEEA